MRSTNLLIIFILFFQLNSSAIARDDLILNREESVLKDFTYKQGYTVYGQCTMAVDKVKSLPSSSKNACKSLLTKAGKAQRHCSIASDVKGCLETVLAIDGDDLLSLARCCIYAEKEGKR